MPAATRPETSLNDRISGALLGLACGVGVPFMAWSVNQNTGPFSAQTTLMFRIFFLIWC